MSIKETIRAAGGIVHSDSNIFFTDAHTFRRACAVDVDALAQYIRTVNGDNKMGAGRLAESIAQWIQEQA